MRHSKQLIRQENFSGGMAVKNPLANTRYPGDAGSIPEEDPQRRKWQPIAVFLPGKSHRQRTLAGSSPWDCRVGHNLATEKQRHTARKHSQCKRRNRVLHLWRKRGICVEAMSWLQGEREQVIQKSHGATVGRAGG